MPTYTAIDLTISVGFDVTGLLQETVAVEATSTFKECIEEDVQAMIPATTLSGWASGLPPEVIADLNMDPDTGVVDDISVKTVLTSELTPVDPDLSRGSIYSKDCVYTPKGWRKTRVIPLSYDGDDWNISSNVIACYVDNKGPNDPPMTNDIRDALTSLRYRATVAWTVYKIL